MGTMNFEEILNNTVIPGNLTKEEQNRLLQPLQDYIKQHTPKKLYKYRSCCNNHISAFYNDQVWVSTAENMNDGFDARLYYNKEEVTKALKDEISEERIIDFIKSAQKDERLRAELAKKPGGQRALQSLYIPIEYLIEGAKETRKRLLSCVDTGLNIFPLITQKSTKFCSLSETVSSPSMWGQYSDNESGFAIEYDFTDIDHSYCTEAGKQVICIGYPIIYKEERFTVPTDYIQYLIESRIHYMNALNMGNGADSALLNMITRITTCPDLLMISKIALYKSLVWQYEKEWRVFCESKDVDHQFQMSSHGCFIKKPTAVYLGRRISTVNEKLLRMLADEKGLPVYKMKLDDASPSYDLKYE